MSKEDHYMAGIDAFAAGNYEEAVAAYQRALAEDQNYTDPLHGLAQIYSLEGRFDEAIEIARKISAIDPDDVMAHTTLSVLYQKQGMIPEAEAEANTARVLSWKQQLKEQKELEQQKEQK